jgi:hypothetical protein
MAIATRTIEPPITISSKKCSRVKSAGQQEYLLCYTHAHVLLSGRAIVYFISEELVKGKKYGVEYYEKILSHHAPTEKNTGGLQVTLNAGV